MYRFRATGKPDAQLRAQLFGSGAILTEVIKAQEILESRYNVGADVWSITSYTELYREGHACERWNMLHPAGQARVPYVTQCLKDSPGVLVAASDYVKSLPDSIDRWLPRPLTALGTDGYGRSESRASLRDFFEVDYRYVILATLSALARDGKIDRSVVEQAIKTHNINPEKLNPAVS
jgi:pyruvate dehydrogenase E1 component